MKPGYKTSEFLLSLLAVLVGAFLSSGMVLETSAAFKMVSLIASALTALGYTVMRTWGKVTDTKAKVVLNDSTGTAAKRDDVSLPTKPSIG